MLGMLCVTVLPNSVVAHSVAYLVPVLIKTYVGFNVRMCSCLPNSLYNYIYVLLPLDFTNISSTFHATFVTEWKGAQIKINLWLKATRYEISVAILTAGGYLPLIFWKHQLMEHPTVFQMLCTICLKVMGKNRRSVKVVKYVALWSFCLCVSVLCRLVFFNYYSYVPDLSFHRSPVKVWTPPLRMRMWEVGPAYKPFC